jgi:hypothetical protein
MLDQIAPAASAPDETVVRPPAPALAGGGLRVIRGRASPLVFGYGPLQRYRELLTRLNCGVAAGVYLLEGREADHCVAREGEALRLETRLADHANALKMRCFDRVAVLSAPGFTKPAAQALEALMARQIAYVGKAIHRSRGATMPEVDAEAWRMAAKGFATFRYAANMVGIDFLEPDAPDDVAAFWNSVTALRERWTPGYFANRKAQMLFGRSQEGPRFELNWGDFIAVCECRNGVYFLLSGSEIRAAPSGSARKSDVAKRRELIAQGKAAPVRGYPDRLQLMVDTPVGESLDRLTKFLLGTLAAAGERWRPIGPAAQPISEATAPTRFEVVGMASPF